MKHAIARIGESGMLPINKQAAHGVGFKLTGADLQVAKTKRAEKERIAKQRSRRRAARQIRTPSVAPEPNRLYENLKYKLDRRVCEFGLHYGTADSHHVREFVSACDDLLIECATKLPRRVATFSWMLARRIKKLPYAARSSPQLRLFISNLPRTYDGYRCQQRSSASLCADDVAAITRTTTAKRIGIGGKPPETRRGGIEAPDSSTLPAFTPPSGPTGPVCSAKPPPAPASAETPKEQDQEYSGWMDSAEDEQDDAWTNEQNRLVAERQRIEDEQEEFLLEQLQAEDEAAEPDLPEWPQAPDEPDAA